MINETFVASDPKSAYDQAIEKYGKEIPIVSAKQIKHDNGNLRCEVVVAVPSELFMERSFGKAVLEPKPIENERSEEEILLSEIGELKAELEIMKDGLSLSIQKEDSVLSAVKALFMKKGISEKWLDMMFTSLIGTPLAEDKGLTCFVLA